MNLVINGEQRQYDPGINALDILAGSDSELKKTAIAARLNGELIELMAPIGQDGTLEYLTFEDDEAKRVLRHTASHVLASAVKTLYPNAKLAIGPAIENGFYYDFDVEEPFTPEALEKIEKQMKHIIKKNDREVRFTLPRDEAIAFMQEKNEPYKAELIRDLPEDEVLSFYRQGDFADLCAGPHLPSTGRIKAFKLTSVAGAYWRGDEKNKMLQRIYGTAFSDKEELDKYLEMLEEAKKRDHRKLGRELDLFDILDEGPGFPFFYPKGMVLRNTLENYWHEIHENAGYEEVKTPVILNRSLWEQSGHWVTYRENMYFTKIDDQDYAIKPMNCPGGILAFKRRMWSYRDLPRRMGELGLVHRHEKSGTLHGLMRVRCFTQDDAHIFCTPEQLVGEVIGVLDFVDYVMARFGYTYKAYLATRPEKSIGSDEVWEHATRSLIEAMDARGLNYEVDPGGGVFYGPKIDIKLYDALGREWQGPTVQADFNMPERFDVNYVGPDGAEHRVVMIHRVVLGSMERFVGGLIEHYAGAFPTWLAPVQVILLPIAERHGEYAHQVAAELRAAGLRVQVDDRSEKTGFKIREAQLQKIPYMLVTGDREVEQRSVSVRSRDAGDLGAMSVEGFLRKIQEEVAG